MSALLYGRIIHLDPCSKNGRIRVLVDRESVCPLAPEIEEGVTIKGGPAKLGDAPPEYPTHVELPLNGWVFVRIDRLNVGRLDDKEGKSGGVANHLMINHKEISRAHLALVEQAKGYLLIVEDADGNPSAKNGTSLNNIIIEKNTTISAAPTPYEISLADGTCVIELFVQDPYGTESSVHELPVQAKEKAPSKVITQSGLVLSLSEKTVRTGEQSVALPRREFLVLRMLMKNPRMRFSNEELWAACHPGENLPPESTIGSNVNVIINLLRRLLEKIDEYHDYIINIRGGYAFKKEKREE